MPLSLTLFVDPCHSQFEVVLHPLVDIIHVLAWPDTLYHVVVPILES